jgi:hypothetical protein
MGAWGPKLYQDDISLDVKAVFLDYRRNGKTMEEVMQCLMNDFGYVIEDIDDSIPFWLTLADLQWRQGDLLPCVKQKAMEILNGGADLKRWKEENPRFFSSREKELNILKLKLTSPLPPKKEYPPIKLFRCEWKDGDLFALPITRDYPNSELLKGRNILIHKIGDSKFSPGHVIPRVRVKITDTSDLPKDLDEVNRVRYIPLTRYKTSDFLVGYVQSYDNTPFYEKLNHPLADENGFYSRYIGILYFTSRRAIPKNLVYLGNYPNLNPPRYENVTRIDDDVFLFLKDLEEKVVGYYNLHMKNE